MLLCNLRGLCISASENTSSAESNSWTNETRAFHQTLHLPFSPDSDTGETIILCLPLWTWLSLFQIWFQRTNTAGVWQFWPMIAWFICEIQHTYIYIYSRALTKMESAYMQLQQRMIKATFRFLKRMNVVTVHFFTKC